MMNANQVPQNENQLPPEESDDLTASFEEAIADRDRQQYYLRLYIAGTTPRSMRAIESIKLICETHLQGRYELEVIDVYQSTQTMQLDNVMAIPTLVKQLPLPLQRMIGDLSNTEKVLIGLNLVPK